MSAFRKRGLRIELRIAAPQVVGSAPRTASNEKADTMSFCLLRNVIKVQPQTIHLKNNGAGSQRALSASRAARLRSAAAPAITSHKISFLGA